MTLQTADINPNMILKWSEAIAASMRMLDPLQQEIVLYIANLPGRRKPSGTHSMKAWRLSRDQMMAEYGYALKCIRSFLNEHGLQHSGDLQFD